MQNYNPEVPPNPAEWLAIDEQSRIRIVEKYHRNARVKVPNLNGHAIYHAIVENQIAEGLESVLRAMTRLIDQGLSRHEALHAIGSCVADYVFEVLSTEDKDSAGTAQNRYEAAVEGLTAMEWRRKYQ